MQKAVITGAAGGLGSATAASLRDAGIDVVAPGRPELDVSSPESVKAFFADGKVVDLLVCNAGLTVDKPLARMTESDWSRVLDVNLKGAFLCAREVARGMIKRRSGHVVFISSFSAIHPPVGQANYAAAKAGLLGMMKSMAQELSPRNIRVNTIMPGFLETRMTARLPVSVKNAALNRHHLGRFNTAEVVGDFITFLHQRMPHTSGQVFNLDSRVVT